MTWADGVGAVANALLVLLAVASAALAYREFRLNQLTRLAQEFSEKSYHARFGWLVGEVRPQIESVRRSGTDLLLAVGPSNKPFSAMEVVPQKGALDRLVAHHAPDFDAVLSEPVFVEVAQDALGLGWSQHLRSDFADFGGFARRVAIWVRLHSLMRGDYWEPTRFREWRSRVGVEVVAQLHARERWKTHRFVRGLLVWAGFFGPRISIARRRRLLRVAEVLGSEFLQTMQNHRYLVAHLTFEIDGESNQDWFEEKFSFFAWDYMTLNEMLLEVTSELGFIEVDWPQVWQLEHRLASSNIREWQPWLRVSERAKEIRDGKPTATDSGGR